MRNQYPGICYRCGLNVEAGAGHFEKIKSGAIRWRVQHANCAIKYRGTDHTHTANKRTATTPPTR